MKRSNCTSAPLFQIKYIYIYIYKKKREKNQIGASVPVHPKCVPVQLTRKPVVAKVYRYTLNVYRYTIKVYRYTRLDFGQTRFLIQELGAFLHSKHFLTLHKPSPSRLLSHTSLHKLGCFCQGFLCLGRILFCSHRTDLVSHLQILASIFGLLIVIYGLVLLDLGDVVLYSVVWSISLWYRQESVV